MYRFYALLYTLLLLTGCNKTVTNSSPTPPPIASRQLSSPKAEPIDLSSPINSFAFKLLPLQQQDFIFSPASLFFPLLLVGQGAQGKTQQEFKQLLIPNQQFSSALLAGVKKILLSYKNTKQLQLSNSFWLAPKFELNKTYAQLSKQSFFTPSFNIDFSLPSSRITINNFVEQHTNHRVKDLLPQDSLDALTRAVLINTIFFLGKWQESFDKKLTRPMTFYTGSKKRTIPFMQKELKLNFYKDKDVTFINLPYKGKRFSYTVIMPTKNNKKFFTTFTLKHFLQLQVMAKYMKVFLSLPKFTATSTLPIKQQLQHLGLTQVFSQRLANLHGISKLEDLFITDIFHKAFIQVDEQGTEAAAATAVVMGIKSMHLPPPRVVINRPFLYMIYDNKLHTILFFGKQSFDKRK